MLQGRSRIEFGLIQFPFRLLCLLSGNRGNVCRVAGPGLLVRVSRTNQCEGERGAQNFLCVHRYEQAARYGSELRPGQCCKKNWGQTSLQTSAGHTCGPASCVPVMLLN